MKAVPSARSAGDERSGVGGKRRMRCIAVAGSVRTLAAGEGLLLLAVYRVGRSPPPFRGIGCRGARGSAAERMCSLSGTHGRWSLPAHRIATEPLVVLIAAITPFPPRRLCPGKPSPV